MTSTTLSKQFISLPQFLQRIHYVMPSSNQSTTFNHHHHHHEHHEHHLKSSLSNNSMNVSRLIGLDVGQKFVGIALSDDENRVAIASDFGLKRFKNDHNMHEMSQALDEICEQNNVMALVVGVPSAFTSHVLDICHFVQHLTNYHHYQQQHAVPSSSSSSLQLAQEKTRNHYYQLKRLPHLPILLQDETYTTYEAYGDVHQGKRHLSADTKSEILSTMSAEEKRHLDQAAAARILQRTLDDIHEHIRIYHQQKQQREQEQQRRHGQDKQQRRNKSTN